MTGCREAAEQLSALHDGALAADARAEVALHVEGCAACRDRIALFAAQGDALREHLSARSAGVDFSRLTDRVMARVARQRPLSLPERLSHAGGQLWAAHRAALAATGSFALAACLAVALFFRPLLPDETVQQAELSSDATLSQVDEVDFGSHDGAVLRLPDKTQVIWLGEDHDR